MAIYCQFINLIIPIKNIDLVYPGGFIKYKEDYAFGFSIGALWNDDFLFRDGSMSMEDLDYRIKKWESLGLNGLREINGEEKWIDFCLFEDMIDGDNIPCDWLLYDAYSKCVYLKDQPFGEIAFSTKKMK